MKKMTLFLGLVLLVASFPYSALAQKKYRYIKREHGVKLTGNAQVPFKNLNATALSVDLEYTYNIKGLVEVGPYVGFDRSGNGSFFAGGLKSEYNIIKNTGKRRFIPAVGITLGVVGNTAPAAGVHASFKLFPAKRTAFVTTVGYQLTLQPNFGFNFGGAQHGADVKIGYAYYFDFY